ncbi:MAG: carbohydrate ABC transporter permease [Chloroflexi bacterium]|nr:carbohydrate ABC transporter permease [Chloroflexota bacterium]
MPDIPLIPTLIVSHLIAVVYGAFGTPAVFATRNRDPQKGRTIGIVVGLVGGLAAVYALWLIGVFVLTTRTRRHIAYGIEPPLIRNRYRLENLRIMSHLLLLVITLLMAVPTLWMVSTALKPGNRVREVPIKWYTSDMTLDNFQAVLDQYDMDEWFVNSTIVAVATTAIGLAVYSLAAYPLARMEFPGKRFIFLGILATMLIPVEATMIPMFIALTRMKVLSNQFGNYSSLVLPVVANAFGLYLLVQFYQTIPVEVEDAARIDGCSELGLYWRIMLPLVRPAMATAGIFTFMASWNNYVWPFIAANPDTQTLPVGLAIAMGSITGSPASVDYGVVMAGMTLATLPPLIIFVLLQRYFVQGISMTGVKG